MTHIIIPIGICVVLPVSIVLIVFLAVMNSENKRTKVLIKAIEANNIDTSKLIDAFQKPRKPGKTAREVLNLRLLRGCIFSFVGLILVAIGLFNYSDVRYFAADPVTIPMIFGGISLAVGASYLIVYCVTRKQVSDSE